jgi:D-glycero-D-manno-heptose 1,7-bisphosphate phosphatase
MRAVFVIAPDDEAAERLWRAARELDHRGHAIAVLAAPGAGEVAPFPVHEGVWRGAPAALEAGRLLAKHDAELAVAEDPKALGFLRWAARVHPSTVVTAMAAADGETAERELEAGRALARGYRRAVFLDRDGTLMPEVGALGRPEAVRLMPGVGAALRTLAQARYELVVVSNQSAIGRGAVTADQVMAVNAALRRALRNEGVELSGIFVCPHRPEDGCDCRKPLPGLFHQAEAALDLSLSASWLIGDSTRDTDAAASAGVQGILLQTGWGGGDPAAPNRVATARPARNIEAAARMILQA